MLIGYVAIIGAILGIILGIKMFKEDHEWVELIGAPIGCALFLGFLAFFISLVICSLVPKSAYHRVDDWTVNLVSVKDNYGIQGKSYALGRGYINSELYFTYYYDAGNGTVKSGNFPADRCEIVYIEDGEQPYIQVSHTEPKSEIIMHLFGWLYGEQKYESFHVPRGSIVDTYEFDLN